VGGPAGAGVGVSTGDRIPMEKGQALYDELAARLAPVVERISPAGSLRRECATLGDIEVVAIPKPNQDLFGAHFYTDESIKFTLKAGGYPPEYRKDGPLYKQFIWRGVIVDLLLTTPPQWGLILALRTGPAEFSHRLVTRRNRGGLCPSWATIQDGRLWDGQGNPIDTMEEQDLFKAMGLDWIEPEKRA
jgi:DNA polymerase/3'-5' exonuclease PolX